MISYVDAYPSLPINEDLFLGVVYIGFVRTIKPYFHGEFATLGAGKPRSQFLVEALLSTEEKCSFLIWLYGQAAAS